MQQGSRSHSKRLCLRDFAEHHGPIHPPIFPHSEAGLTFLGRHHFPRGSTLFLGGDPGQGSGRLAASGQNMNLAGEEVSILVLGIGSGSAGWRMDPPRELSGISPEGLEVAGNSVCSVSPLATSYGFNFACTMQQCVLR